MLKVNDADGLALVKEKLQACPTRPVRCWLVIALITILQLRQRYDQELEARYRAAMLAGEAFPPIQVALDPDTLICRCHDGAHRVGAGTANGATHILAEVVLGTEFDALLLAAGANDRHGCPRTNEDKRHAVQALLARAECATWSSTRIARFARVSTPLVEELRQAAEEEADAGHTGRPTTRTVVRGGKAYAMRMPAKKARDRMGPLVTRVAAIAKTLDADARQTLAERLRQAVCEAAD